VFGSLLVLCPVLLSWLILGIDLTELKDAQIAGEALFLGVSVKGFPEEIGF
jgi:hypothetical protein